MKTEDSDGFEGIDVLRGPAAMCAVVSRYSTHCVKFFREAPFGFDPDTIYGFYAVQLFFIISGFVISLTLEKSNSWRDFAFSRLSRLYPPPCRVTGDALAGGTSYPLYLIHRNLGFSTMFRLHEVGVPSWLLFTVTLAAALVLATPLAYLVEKPALRALRRWYRTRRRAAVVRP
ncbi:MAG: acyltransferase family protein [Burkholderiales bacterium]